MPRAGVHMTGSSGPGRQGCRARLETLRAEGQESWEDRVLALSDDPRDREKLKVEIPS